MIGEAHAGDFIACKGELQWSWHVASRGISFRQESRKINGEAVTEHDTVTAIKKKAAWLLLYTDIRAYIVAVIAPQILLLLLLL